jgi:hypothetical protein
MPESSKRDQLLGYTPEGMPFERDPESWCSGQKIPDHIHWRVGKAQVCAECGKPICGAHYGGRDCGCTRTKGHPGKHLNQFIGASWTDNVKGRKPRGTKPVDLIYMRRRGHDVEADSTRGNA